MGIARNYIYNATLTIANLIVPFITTPYITRVLDPEGVGSVAFTASIVQYFVFLATLGVDLYGTRELAFVKEEPEKLRRMFWSIFFSKLLTSSISFLTFLIFVFFLCSKHTKLYLIQSMQIINAAIDITFLYSGLEDFKRITLRGLIARFSGVVLLFILVRKPSDYYLYALISVTTILVGNVWMWMNLPSIVLRVVRPSFEELRRHLSGALRLFIPLAAIQVYVALDKTMVGVLSNESEVAYYDMSQRVVKMILGLVTAIGPVMIPRMSSLIAQGMEEEKKRYVKIVFEFVTYSSTFIIVLLAITMRDFVPLFFGNKFLKVKDLIIYISPIILFISWSNLFGMQLMVPMKKEPYLTVSVTCGAVTNFAMNLLLIPRYKALGAVIGTVIAEFIVTFVQIVLIRKMLDLKDLFKDSWKHFLAGAITLITLLTITRARLGLIGKMVIEVLLGMVVYVLVEHVLKSDINSYLLKKAKQTFAGFISISK